MLCHAQHTPCLHHKHTDLSKSGHWHVHQLQQAWGGILHCLTAYQDVQKQVLDQHCLPVAVLPSGFHGRHALEQVA